MKALIRGLWKQRTANVGLLRVYIFVGLRVSFGDLSCCGLQNSIHPDGVDVPSRPSQLV